MKLLLEVAALGRARLKPRTRLVGELTCLSDNEIRWETHSGATCDVDVERQCLLAS